MITLMKDSSEDLYDKSFEEIDDTCTLTINEDTKALAAFDRQNKAPAPAATTTTKIKASKTKIKVKDIQAQLGESLKALEKVKAEHAALKEYTRMLPRVEAGKSRSKYFSGSIINVGLSNSEP
ncbi:unnamed protein product [Sympodiomycopsis kandeliae]